MECGCNSTASIGSSYESPNGWKRKKSKKKKRKKNKKVYRNYYLGIKEENELSPYTDENIITQQNQEIPNNQINFKEIDREYNKSKELYINLKKELAKILKQTIIAYGLRCEQLTYIEHRKDCIREQIKLTIKKLISLLEECPKLSHHNLKCEKRIKFLISYLKNQLDASTLTLPPESK